MLKQEFQFDLPEHLIAYAPCEKRTDSRLLVIDPDQQSINHHHFYDLIDFIQPNDCLIFNNTKVIPARLFGMRESGGKVEVLIERVVGLAGDAVNNSQKQTCLAQVRASNSPKAGVKIKIADDFCLEVTGRQDSFYVLENKSDSDLMMLIEKYGDMPLPPYIQRKAEEVDKERYQTVYAQERGAVAAPTAGLHFDEALIKKIKDKGIQHDFVTLHVGAGTFLPLRVDNIKDHQMHSEWFSVSESVVELVKKTKKKGGRVIAVGTTSVRCLESASKNGEIAAMEGETDIFIYPGYEFQNVDGLITNFHLSESTLMMLVSTFAGCDFIKTAYQEAIKAEYRFFSYGDSMFIENRLLRDVYRDVH
ncbi:MAG: tRNA preQ1(34) S-adenosylmethionine ribosyltransferase-isomerase QueA [Gammaproteobacteria bacterium]|nr:MAG: tRNA preQ1(34) S-adenosylmethionine ribosyltransferase-isomerase QueA [Gammaproteobacteria bacterium]